LFLSKAPLELANRMTPRTQVAANVGRRLDADRVKNLSTSSANRINVIPMQEIDSIVYVVISLNFEDFFKGALIFMFRMISPSANRMPNVNGRR